MREEIIFRMTHLQPSRMKRPLGLADSLSSLHVAIRMYTILEVSEDCSLATVFRGDSPEVDVIELFSGSAEQAKAMFSSLKVRHQKELAILPAAGRP